MDNRTLWENYQKALKRIESLEKKIKSLRFFEKKYKTSKTKSKEK